MVAVATDSQRRWSRIPDEGGDKDVFVNDFVTVTDASGSKVEAAPLTWKQCYLKKSTEDLFRAACTPDSMYTLNFALGLRMTTSGGLPAETTANESLGVINPGDTWKGRRTFSTTVRRGATPVRGPFTTPGGPRTDATGKSTPYMLADVLPRYVTDMTANDQRTRCSQRVTVANYLHLEAESQRPPIPLCRTS